MSKQPVNLRLSSEADRAADRLRADYGHESRTDAVEASLVCWQTALDHASQSVAAKFTRPEWNLIADVCNGTMWAYGHTGSHPGMLLAAEVCDGHRLDGKGYNWLLDSDEPTLALSPAQRAKADDLAGDLVRRLNALEYVEAWAVIRAVCWFWQHNDIDFQTDEWWTLEYRRSRPHDRSAE